jgi:hypothetical protein
MMAKEAAEMLGMSPQKLAKLGSRHPEFKPVIWTPKELATARKRLAQLREGSSSGGVPKRQPMDVAGADSDMAKAIEDVRRSPERYAKLKYVLGKVTKQDKEIEKLKLEIQDMAGNTLSREEAHRTWAAHVQAARNALMRVPNRSVQLVGLDERAIETTLAEWLREICDSLAGDG